MFAIARKSTPLSQQIFDKMRTGRTSTPPAAEGRVESMPDDVSKEVFGALADFISREDFVCLGARAALRRKSIVHHHYQALDQSVSMLSHHRDLIAFLEDFQPSDRSFTSFVATFGAPTLSSEDAFEKRVWDYLQALHDHDSRQYPWNDQYDADPASSNFAFSVGSHPFFIVGLHPAASRPSRRFSVPALVFNSHIQFNAMGMRFLTMKRKIRRRERAFHGSVNPSFVQYKDEARHYAGRLTETEWRCPFEPRR
jgi:FPC/CPF motif-containing protein YcgG